MNQKQSVELKEKNVLIRPVDHSDSADIIRWRNQPFVRQHFIYQGLFTEETQRRWMETMVMPGHVRQFIICILPEKKPVGSIYFRDIDEYHQKAEYGIFIGEEKYLGKGIGTVAGSLGIKYAFEILKLHKVFLRVLAENTTAINSYLNIGFTREGYFKEDVKIGDDYRDVVFMGLLRKDYLKRKKCC